MSYKSNKSKFCMLAASVAVVVGGISAVAAQAESTLHMGVTFLPPPRGNPYAAGIFPSWHTWSAMFDPLIFVDEKDGSAKPWLATSWKNIDKTTWQFTLRPGVTFDNREPVDAQAAVAAINWLRGTDLGKTMFVSREIRSVASARAIDALTLEVKTAGPDAILPSRIASMLLVAPKAWRDLGVAGYAAQPVGSGSFRAASWGPDKVEYVARSDSWRPPKVDAMTVVPLGERTARVQALTSGQLDIAPALSVDNIAEVEGAGHRIDIVPSTNAIALALFNSAESAHPALKDQRVRQALNYAVNKESMVQNLLGGHSKVSAQGATPNTFGYDPSLKPYAYDPDKAKKLLSEAGYGDGLKLVAEVVVGVYAGDSEIFQQVAADLKKIGVDLELQQIVTPDWINKFLTGTWSGHLANMPYNSAPYNDATRFMAFTFCKDPFPYFCAEEEVPLIRQANAIFDVEERRKYLNERLAAQHERAPSIFLVDAIEISGVNKRLLGFKNLGKTFNYHEISIAN